MLLCAPREARAEDGEPAPELGTARAIAVVAPPGDKLGRRLTAELEALGFRVVPIDPEKNPASRASLEESARRSGALAAIRAVPSERGVEVWIADRVTGKTVLREMLREEGAHDRDGALALRTVELLRASLIEVALPSSRGDVDVADDLRDRLNLPAPESSAPPRLDRLRFSLGAGPLLSAGGFGPSCAVQGGVAWMPLDFFGFAVTAWVQATTPTVRAAEGTASLSAMFVGGGPRFRLAERRSAWSPTLDIGMAAVLLRSSGSASQGYVSGTSSGAGAAPYLQPGIAFWASRTVRVRADVLVGLLAAGATVTLGSQRAATWGAPFVLPSAGLDFGWF
ncbi:MAG TPA: hypothetical protein VGM56_28215 [Byssovorax sp.]